jgi:hypothetical protein
MAVLWAVHCLSGERLGGGHASVPSLAVALPQVSLEPHRPSLHPPVSPHRPSPQPPRQAWWFLAIFLGVFTFAAVASSHFIVGKEALYPPMVVAAFVGEAQ